MTVASTLNQNYDLNGRFQPQLVSSIIIVSDAPNCGVTYDCHYDDRNSFIIQATGQFPNVKTIYWYYTPFTPYWYYISGAGYPPTPLAKWAGCQYIFAKQCLIWNKLKLTVLLARTRNKPRHSTSNAYRLLPPPSKHNSQSLQGALTEGESSVQLNPCTNRLRSVALDMDKIFFFFKTSFLNEEVKCKERSPSVSVPLSCCSSFYCA